MTMVRVFGVADLAGSLSRPGKNFSTSSRFEVKLVLIWTRMCVSESGRKPSFQEILVLSLQSCSSGIRQFFSIYRGRNSTDKDMLWRTSKQFSYRCYIWRINVGAYIESYKAFPHGVCIVSCHRILPFLYNSSLNVSSMFWPTLYLTALIVNVHQEVWGLLRQSADIRSLSKATVFTELAISPQ